MNLRPLPPIESLDSAFQIDPSAPSGLSRRSGSPAGSRTARGYWRVCLGGQRLFVHRVVLALATGCDPYPLQVDHSDGNCGNNAVGNLRLCTHGQNASNRKSGAGASSPYLGVSWCKQGCLWVSRLRSHGKKHYLGRFKSETEAARAYDAAAIELHGEFASLNFPTAPTQERAS